jgi:hypothetical protein
LFIRALEKAELQHRVSQSETDLAKLHLDNLTASCLIGLAIAPGQPLLLAQYYDPAAAARRDVRTICGEVLNFRQNGDTALFP